MIMSQALEAELEKPAFIIEATSHCRDGKQPRWTFLIQGVGNNPRHGMVRTDEHGRGLYLYQGATRTQLIAPEDLSLADSLSRHQANAEVMKRIHALNWNAPLSAPVAHTPPFTLYAVV